VAEYVYLCPVSEAHLIRRFREFDLLASSDDFCYDDDRFLC
jgi:hypothetical protein